MKRTTVFLEDSIVGRANRYAEKHGMSFASVVREALAQFLTSSGSPKRKLPSIAGRYNSRMLDGAENIEDMLWEDPHD